MSTTHTQQLQHIAIIMDGNRRWAKARSLTVGVGHEEGYRTLVKICEHAFNRKGVGYVTVFAFSTENWSRPKQEITLLLSLFKKAFKERINELHRQGIQLRFLGDLSRFPKGLQDVMRDGMASTSANTGGVLTIALNYGGRSEIISVIKSLIEADVSPESITEELVSTYLYTKTLPDPELVIRTSGEQRLSGFLPWQTVYSELYFSKKYWPDFTERDLDEAIEEFHHRHRRYGK